MDFSPLLSDWEDLILEDLKQLGGSNMLILISFSEFVKYNLLLNN